MTPQPPAHDHAVLTPRMVIGGGQVTAASGETFDVVSPVNGRVIARVPRGGA